MRSKEYSREYWHKYYRENPIKVKALRKSARRKRDYGITTNDYNKLVLDQKGCCAICGRNPSESEKYLYIDHDHTSGIVRGLLCRRCNVALGMMNEDIDILKAAIMYLQK